MSEQKPMSARFTLRRSELESLASSPWILKDAKRPAFVGRYATRDLGLAAVSAKLREEADLPPVLNIDVDEILAAMVAQRRGEPCRCSVVPMLDVDVDEIVEACS